MVEYRKSPTNFEENITVIPQKAKLSISEEVTNHYRQLVPTLKVEPIHFGKMQTQLWFGHHEGNDPKLHGFEDELREEEVRRNQYAIGFLSRWEAHRRHYD